MKTFDIVLQQLENICGPGIYYDLTESDYNDLEHLCLTTHHDNIDVVKNEGMCGIKLYGKFVGPYWCKVEGRGNNYSDGWWYNWFDKRGHPSRVWSSYTFGSNLSKNLEWTGVCNVLPQECDDLIIERILHYNLIGEKNIKGSYVICLNSKRDIVRYVRLLPKEITVYYFDKNGEIVGKNVKKSHLETYEGFDGVIKRCDDVLELGDNKFFGTKFNYTSKICYICVQRKTHVEDKGVNNIGNVCLECRAKDIEYFKGNPCFNCIAYGYSIDENESNLAGKCINCANHGDNFSYKGYLDLLTYQKFN